MIAVPEFKPAGAGVHLMSGALLNRLVAAVQARTQLNPQEANAQGMRGATSTGGGVKIAALRGKYDPQKTYVLSAAFLQRLQKAIRRRSPLEAAQIDRSGWDVGGAGVHADPPKVGSTGPALKGTFEALRRITPHRPASSSPQGYLLKGDGTTSTPRTASIVFQTQDMEAGARFCTGLIGPGPGLHIFSTLTITTTYVHGVITTIETQHDIGPHLENADNPPFTCHSPEITDDRVAGKDYGAETDSVNTWGGEVSIADAEAMAIGGVEITGDPVDEFAWEWDEFTPPPDIAAAVAYLGLAYFATGGMGAIIAHRPKYRWRNTGQLHVGIEWTEGGTTRSLKLAPGADTDWYDSTMPGTISIFSYITDAALTCPVTLP